MTNEEAMSNLEKLLQIYDDGMIDFSIIRESIKAATEALQKRIPKKPNEAIANAWGMSVRQAVCPECDYYLGQIYFIGDGKRKIAYCERCGQAVDFSEWEGEG